MNEKNIPLNDLEIGKRALVSSLISEGLERRRMLDLGLIKGTVIEAVQMSPFGDPVAYFIRGALIALRSEDARKIIVTK